jgi:hypothetical protein
MVLGPPLLRQERVAEMSKECGLGFRPRQRKINKIALDPVGTNAVHTGLQSETPARLRIVIRQQQRNKTVKKFFRVLLG